MKKRYVKIVVMSVGGAAVGSAIGYLGQCAGST